MSDVATTLDDLLDADLSYAPTYRGYLSNHLSMALIAKATLGAPASVLRAFADDYVARLQPRATRTETLTTRTWRGAIGQDERAEDLSDFFRRALDHGGVDAVLATTLPTLVAGAGGAAFHGAIRLAYALEHPTDERVAAALGYFASVAATLGPDGPAPARTSDPSQILSEMRSSGAWIGCSEAQSISAAMAESAAHPRFAEMTSALAVDESTPAALAHTALALFASTGDFIALHGVTGLAALQALRGYVSDTASFDRQCFRALAAAYLAIGAPPLWSAARVDEFVASASANRDDVAAVGARTTDEHVAKLINTAHHRYDETGDPLYLAVAAREAGLVAPPPE